MQQLARLAPGAIRHDQQAWLAGAACHQFGQALRLLTGEQQARLVTRPLPVLRLEAFADQQLCVLQPQHRQPRGVQCMADLARVLQDQHSRPAVQAGNQRAQAMRDGPLATRTARPGAHAFSGCVRSRSRKFWISGSRERPRRRISENGA
ncbi:hypothetical protein D9M71_676520 [compost metagenome]